MSYSLLTQPRTMMNDGRTLSQRDASVLAAIFDPEASLQKPVPVYTSTEELYNSDTIRQVKEQERRAILLMNQSRPELENVKTALRTLDDIITAHPRYASAWNNRAQAIRILCDISETDVWHDKASQMYEDLSQAIQLSQPDKELGGVPASSIEVLASAHTHRGLLLWQISRSEHATEWSKSIRELRTLNSDVLEELASKDFQLGGKYGSQMAQQLAVKTNPYAKLCGSIVREAITKEIEECRQQHIV